MNYKPRFKYYALTISIVYWIIDSTIHKLAFGEEEFEFIPGDINELWMRTLIVCLVLVFGFYIDYSMKKLVKKEQEKLEVYQSTVLAVQHVLNNHLHKMQIFKSKMSKCDNISDTDVENFNKLVKETTESIKNLSNVTEVDAKTILHTVDPRAK